MHNRLSAMSVTNDNTADEQQPNDTNNYNGYNFGKQDEETALSNYNMHDVGEMVTMTKLEKLGINFTDECGFDGREYIKGTDYDSVTDVPDEEVNDVADLQLEDNPDVLIDIKTTSGVEWIGNMEKTAWYKHKNQVQNGKEVVIVCFALDDDNEVVKAGCYLMSEMESTGGNPAGGRYFKHCNQEKINDMDSLENVITQAVNKVSN